MENEIPEDNFPVTHNNMNKIRKINPFERINFILFVVMSIFGVAIRLFKYLFQ